MRRPRNALDRNYPAAGDALRRALEIQPDSGFSLSSLAMLQLLEESGGGARDRAENRFRTVPPADHRHGRVQPRSRDRVAASAR